MNSLKPAIKFRKSVWIFIFKVVLLEVIYFFGVIVMMFLLTNIATPRDFLASFLFFTALINICLVIYIFLLWLSCVYTITPHFLERNYGIFRKRKNSYDLKLIQEIRLRQSLPGRIFDYGTLKMFNPTVKDEFVFVGISQPSQRLQIIKSFIQEIESSRSSNAYIFKH